MKMINKQRYYILGAIIFCPVFLALTVLYTAQKDVPIPTSQSVEEQRRVVFAEREVRIEKEMDEYFDAPTPEAKEQILDRRIDEMQVERAKHEQERAEREPTTRPDRLGSDRNMSPQDRKTRSETRNPDLMAKRMEYFRLLRERMKARGIEPPRWGRR
jgi:hypothetical protein